MEEDLSRIKEKILKQVMEKSGESHIDFSRLDGSVFRRRIETVFKSILERNREISLTRHEQQEVLSEIISYLLGLGPIDNLLKDPEVSEIMVNGPKQVYIERNGNLELTDVTFRDEEHMMYFIERIISPFEVLDMIQAMNTGHEGSMATLHANSPLEALDRLEVLALMGSTNISSEVARRQLISG